MRWRYDNEKSFEGGNGYFVGGTYMDYLVILIIALVVIMIMQDNKQ